MWRQRNNSQSKGKEESPKRVLNEKKEASTLSHVQFKTMVIRKLSENIKNYRKLQGTYYELHQHEKGHRNYQKEPQGNEEYNFSIEEHTRRNQKQAR